MATLEQIHEAAATYEEVLIEWRHGDADVFTVAFWKAYWENLRRGQPNAGHDLYCNCRHCA